MNGQRRAIVTRRQVSRVQIITALRLPRRGALSVTTCAGKETARAGNITQHQSVIIGQPQRRIKRSARQPAFQQRDATGHMAGGMWVRICSGCHWESGA